MADPLRIAPLRIALIGDYNPTKEAHQGIPPSLTMAAATLGVEIGFDWIGTETVPQAGTDTAAFLAGYDGLWCVPGSPYRSMEGALAAIRTARETRLPFLGTCGGFQHALIDYMREVLDQRAADHAESNPEAEMAVIAPLACSLKGATGTIHLTPGSRLAAIFGRASTIERYHCNYGFNPAYRALIDGGVARGGLCFTGFDPAGEPRAFELGASTVDRNTGSTGHPFFIATLFQPERAALRGEHHPLIAAFVAAARSHQGGRNR
jgi:CTP synthase (UTP-ammonia lyase)